MFSIQTIKHKVFPRQQTQILLSPNNTIKHKVSPTEDYYYLDEEPKPKEPKWTADPAKYRQGDNWFTKETVFIDGKEMTIADFKEKATLYRSLAASYNNYFPTK